MTTEPQISDEAVEAAAKAVYGETTHYYLGLTRRWLTAVVPHLHEQCAKTVEAMCDWRYNPDNDHDYTEQHWAYHFGRWPGQTGVCPYAAMAAVLRGRPDPRHVAVARGDVQPGGQQ